jgi:hypothetical protein
MDAPHQQYHGAGMSGIFTVTVNCGNASFADAFEPERDKLARGYEVARILRELAKDLENGHASGRLRDSAGNVVGNYSFQEKA